MSTKIVPDTGPLPTLPTRMLVERLMVDSRDKAVPPRVRKTLLEAAVRLRTGKEGM